MHRINALLGMPQHRFASIHVVGTNGKSSVTRMTAALLEAHGLSTGACLSPHPGRLDENSESRPFDGRLSEKRFSGSVAQERQRRLLHRKYRRPWDR